MKMTKERMIAVPSMNFKDAYELLESNELNNEEKLTALYNWKQMCELEKASTNEGMKGERTTPYTSILAAIRKLTGQE